jgi:hypothetical protein
VVIGRIDNPITGTPAEFVSGLLTFFPERLEFNSRDLNFALPYASIEKVDCAGARETFLTIRIDPRDEFSKLYGKYRLIENYRFVPGVRFSLEMAEEVAPAYKTVQAFQRYMQEVLDARRSSLVGVVGNTGTITRSGPPEAASAQGSVGRSPATVLLVLDAYYLEKRPGAIMTSLGKPGELVFRGDGIGFHFREREKLSADCQKAAGNDRIFISGDSIQSAYVRDQKLLPGMTHTMFFVVLKPRPASEAWERLHPFLTAEGELIFTVRNVNESSRVSSLLGRFAASGF